MIEGWAILANDTERESEEKFPFQE